MYDHQRGRVEHRSRCQWVQNVQDIRYYMPHRSRGHHYGVRNKWSQRREKPRNRTMLIYRRQHYLFNIKKNTQVHQLSLVIVMNNERA